MIVTYVLLFIDEFLGRHNKSLGLIRARKGSHIEREFTINTMGYTPIHFDFSLMCKCNQAQYVPGGLQMTR